MSLTPKGGLGPPLGTTHPWASPSKPRARCWWTVKGVGQEWEDKWDATAGWVSIISHSMLTKHTKIKSENMHLGTQPTLL